MTLGWAVIVRDGLMHLRDGGVDFCSGDTKL